MAETNYERLRRLLAELFMFDQADLDFGIYRVMNVRRDEIRRFLDDDLLPQVQDALAGMAAGEREALVAEIEKAEAQAQALGVVPETVPRVRELRATYKAAPDPSAAEDEVYSHLIDFFRRYYREGDFISQRRYKEGVYAIPYEGEEVKLHWANHDQYYIKSTEQFRDYSFRLGVAEADQRRVHFKLIEADIPQGHNLPQATGPQKSHERRFLLADETPIVATDTVLTVRFEYRSDELTRNQADLNETAVHRILADPAAQAWRFDLARAASSAEDAPSLLAKHLSTYTAKNTFDYFIHKDLGSFLRRELDFYLKNEVVRLDDIDTDDSTAQELERYLAKLKAIRRVGHKLIEFLAQIEDFQKRLWLKKKFVVDTHWCVTLDRVPERLYPEIAANQAQHASWVHLFAIDQITDDLPTHGYSEPLTVDFLRTHPYLPIDTSFFDREFTQRLLSSIDNLDETTDGVLVHSENFQALNLLSTTERGRVDLVYIDPPYNSPSTEILYKNNYKHSSWLSLISERLRLSGDLFGARPPHLIAID